MYNPFAFYQTELQFKVTGVVQCFIVGSSCYIGAAPGATP